MPPGAKELLDAKRRVVREILDTESRYLSNLEILRDLYYSPLNDAATLGAAPILSEHDVRTIFLNLEDIILLSAELRKQLSRRIEEESSCNVGDVFSQMVWGFSLYRQFVTGYEVAVQRLREESEKVRFREFIAEVQKNPRSGSLDIHSLLIMPVQRIPRYRLLLVEAFKNTPKDDVDYEPLQAALERTSEVAAFVNEAIRSRENKDKLRELSKRYPVLNEQAHFNPKRVFVKEGLVTKICRKAHKRYTLILFEDILLYKADLDVKMKPRMIQLIGVDDLPDVPSKYRNAMQLRSAKKSFIVYGEDADHKKQWMAALSGACKKEEEAADGAAPVWLHDGESPECLLCSGKFTLFNRRHHCRQCGKLVCNKCSSGRCNLGSEANARVCDPCYRQVAGSSLQRTNSAMMGGDHRKNSSATNERAGSESRPQLVRGVL